MHDDVRRPKEKKLGKSGKISQCRIFLTEFYQENRRGIGPQGKKKERGGEEKGATKGGAKRTGGQPAKKGP